MKRLVSFVLILVIICFGCGCSYDEQYFTHDSYGAYVSSHNEVDDVNSFQTVIPFSEYEIKLVEDADNKIYKQPSNTDDKGKDDWLLEIYHRIGVNTTARRLSGEIAEEFITLLESAKVLQEETGFEYKIVARGDYLIKTQTDNYYIHNNNEDQTSILYHIDDGNALEITDEMEKLLYQIYNYYPRNSFYGRAENGVLTLSHVFNAESTMDIKVKALSKNSITLEVTSTTDQTATLSLYCEASDDVKGSNSSEELTLMANVPQQVSFSFSGGHVIRIYGGNTQIKIAIMD